MIISRGCKGRERKEGRFFGNKDGSGQGDGSSRAEGRFTDRGTRTRTEGRFFSFTDRGTVLLSCPGILPMMDLRFSTPSRSALDFLWTGTGDGSLPQRICPDPPHVFVAIIIEKQAPIKSVLRQKTPRGLHALGVSRVQSAYFFSRAVSASRFSSLMPALARRFLAAAAKFSGVTLARS